MMDGCLCVCTEMTALTTASHQGTIKAEQKLHMSSIFWLNIPVINKLFYHIDPAALMHEIHAFTSRQC